MDICMGGDGKHGPRGQDDPGGCQVLQCDKLHLPSTVALATEKVVTPARFERTTCPLGGDRSIQLSYGALGEIVTAGDWQLGLVVNRARALPPLEKGATGDLLLIVSLKDDCKSRSMPLVLSGRWNGGGAVDGWGPVLRWPGRSAWRGGSTRSSRRSAPTRANGTACRSWRRMQSAWLDLAGG